MHIVYVTISDAYTASSEFICCYINKLIYLSIYVQPAYTT